MKRDSIDFGKDRVAGLFNRMFFPTLFGMLSIAAVTLADGIFVGHGVGSNGIAAVNICIPVQMLFTGIGLMIGVGSSVTAAIHLSTDNVKAARINITQALLAASLVVLLAGALIMAFPSWTCRVLGSSETLLHLSTTYMMAMIPGMFFMMWTSIGLFALRLDGSPRLAMWVNVVSAVVNIFLDWWMVMVLGWGVFGAAFATSISMAVGASIVAVYICGYARHLRWYRLKVSVKSLRLTCRNLWYQCRIGFSALLGEATMAMLMLVGNLVFMRYLGDDGVGAFGLACYFCPFVFMVGNAIAQSAQPIISYNIQLDGERARCAQRYAIATAIVCGLVAAAVFVFIPRIMVGLFLPPDNAAARIAVHGLPYFASGFPFFVLNLTVIGYYQSVEKTVRATVFALMRGFVLLIPSFVLLPIALGAEGIWLAMPLSELLTFSAIILTYLAGRDGSVCRDRCA